jgi:hypothetical protein
MYCAPQANPVTLTTSLFFGQSNHLHHSSSPTMPLRLLFPLACPLPPLLRLLPTPASARFYSPSRLSTSLVTPTSRRPINRRGLLSRRTYIPQQASHTKPTIEEIKEWNEDELLKWIQQKRPGLLRGDNLETADIKSKLLSLYHAHHVDSKLTTSPACRK